MTQYEDFTMATLSQGHARAQRVPKAADLDKVDPQRSVAMYQERFGNAHGMTFALVGSFTPADVKPLVAQYLGGLPGSPRPVAIPRHRPALPFRARRTYACRRAPTTAP